MVVTWVTMHTSPLPVVEYGMDSPSKETAATTTKFIDGGFEKRHMYIHRAVLTDLKPGTKYRKFLWFGVVLKLFSIVCIPDL